MSTTNVCDLSGRTVVVTGGSQGLGKAISRSLAEAGATIAICDVKQEQAAKVAESVTADGGKAKSYFLDVTDADAVAKTLQQVAGDFGGIDVLINNAGTDVTKALEDISVEEFDRVISVNLRGPFLMSKAVLPYFLKNGQENGKGHIINITSTAAKRTWTEASAYHASKWGLLGFSHAIHAEARKHNVKVTAVVAGGMRTAFIMDRFPDTDPNVLQDPKNVADTVRFVLSMPEESVIPEVMVLPMRETSWP